MEILLYFFLAFLIIVATLALLSCIIYPTMKKYFEKQ